jgi:hypothetical protein
MPGILAQLQPLIHERPPKKIASTTVTNELARAISQLGQAEFGSDWDGRAGLIPVQLKITTAATGGGWYNIRIAQYPAGGLPTGTATLSSSQLAQYPNVDDGIGANLQEMGQSTHDLTAGTPKVTEGIGLLLGLNSNNKWVVVFSAEDWEQCSSTPALSDDDTSIYGEGTGYALTTTPGAVAMGTRDPAFTVGTDAGQQFYLRAQVRLDFNGATFAASRTVTIVLHRTSGTPGDIAETTLVLSTPIVTTETSTWGIFELPEVLYTIQDAGGDDLAIYASINTAPSAGSLDIAAASIIAERRT